MCRAIRAAAALKGRTFQGDNHEGCKCYGAPLMGCLTPLLSTMDVCMSYSQAQGPGRIATCEAERREKAEEGSRKRRGKSKAARAAGANRHSHDTRNGHTPPSQPTRHCPKPGSKLANKRTHLKLRKTAPSRTGGQPTHRPPRTPPAHPPNAAHHPPPPTPNTTRPPGGAVRAAAPIRYPRCYRGER